MTQHPAGNIFHFFYHHQNKFLSGLDKYIFYKIIHFLPKLLTIFVLLKYLCGLFSYSYCKNEMFDFNIFKKLIFKTAISN